MSKNIFGRTVNVRDLNNKINFNNNIFNNTLNNIENPEII